MKRIENVALYARVSTKDGRQDTENQLIALREYCAKQGWTIVREYVDHESGGTSKRPRFQQMFAAAAKREFDAVVAWALDRVSREGVQQTFAHISKLTSYGVQFESFTEPHFRTTGPAGELMIAVAAWIAEQERVRRSERARAAIVRLKREGKRLGRRPTEPSKRSKVFALRDEGLSLRQIAGRAGVSPATAGRILAAVEPASAASGVS